MSICRARRSGSVLIVVVWMVAILSLLAAGLGGRSVWLLGLSDRLVEQLQVYSVLAGGAEYAQALLARDPSPTIDGPQEPWRRMAEWTARQPSDAFAVEVGPGLVDEDRLINLSTAPVQVLQRVFQQAGARREAAESLAEAAADWRDEDRDERPHGAEDAYYRGLTEAYECKDAPFESVEELLLVRGMTPAVWRRAAPALTVYGSGKLNLNTADRDAIAALGLSDAGVAGFMAYRAGEDRQLNSDDDRLLPAVASVGSELAAFVPEEDTNRLLALSEFLGVRSEAYRVALSGQQPESSASRMRVACIVTRSGPLAWWREE